MALVVPRRASRLADEHLEPARGLADAKVVAVVTGMVAGADSVSDLDLLRHGGMGSCSRVGAFI